MPDPMRILITGSSGKIGQTLIKGIKDRHRLRGLDRLPTPDLEDARIGELSNLDDVLQAAEGMDAVIHLGAAASPHSPWDQVLQSNIIGTYNVFEAARRCAVKRVVFASRAALLDAYPKYITRRTDYFPIPDSVYSVSKVFGESLAFMYAVQHGMEVVVVRVGHFSLELVKPQHPRHLGHADALRVFEQAATQPDITFEVVFGVSDCSYPMFDLDHGRQTLRYMPSDKSYWSPWRIYRLGLKLWRRIRRGAAA